MALYYECHVTIEPVFDERRDEAAVIARCCGFKLADLLMKKRAEDTEERSCKDTFMTGHATELEPLRGRMALVVAMLKRAGFQVWRYKIEDCVIDSRIGDSEQLLALASA